MDSVLIDVDNAGRQCSPASRQRPEKIKPIPNSEYIPSLVIG
jgi:hypothetical protein